MNPTKHTSDSYVLTDGKGQFRVVGKIEKSIDRGGEIETETGRVTMYEQFSLLSSSRIRTPDIFSEMP